MVSVTESSKGYIHTIHKTPLYGVLRECRWRPDSLITRYIEEKWKEEENRQAHELEAFKQPRDASSLFEGAKSSSSRPPKKGYETK